MIILHTYSYKDYIDFGYLNIMYNINPMITDSPIREFKLYTWDYWCSTYYTDPRTQLSKA